MKAYELTARVGSGHRLEVELPPDAPEGEVKVIVLFPEPCPDEEAEQRRYLEDFFRKLDATDRPRLTKEEIDRYLEEERAGWER